jgi:hypothetical protein
MRIKDLRYPTFQRGAHGQARQNVGGPVRKNAHARAREHGAGRPKYRGAADCILRLPQDTVQGEQLNRSRVVKARLSCDRPASPTRRGLHPSCI